MYISKLGEMKEYYRRGFLKWHHRFAPCTSYSFASCHFLISPPTHHLSVSPPFLWVQVWISMSPLLRLQLVPITSSVCIWILLTFLYYDPRRNTIRLPYNSIFSQSTRLKAMPGGVGINLSPHHSCFLLLSACLIKLPPANPCTHKPISQSSSCPLVFICSTKPCTLCSLYPPAFQSLCNKTRIVGSPTGKMTLHVCLFLCVFVCTNITTQDSVTMAGAAVSS